MCHLPLDFVIVFRGFFDPSGFDGQSKRRKLYDAPAMPVVNVQTSRNIRVFSVGPDDLLEDVRTLLPRDVHAPRDIHELEGAFHPRDPKQCMRSWMLLPEPSPP